VELHQVRYRGRLLLWRAHVPILNVLYDDGVSYRDWQNQETPFQAQGNDPVGSGWRLCTQPPATILEAGTDDGDFQGVALWYEDGELRLVSEMQAGWYRYISDWRLRDDGVIAPRFGFAGTRNPRTCMRHQHHVYWRLDFDIEGSGDDVVQQRGLIFADRFPWTTIVRESSRRRTPLSRSWRVLDATSERGYRIVPGVADGTADAYGVADLWFLRYHGDELEDGVMVVGGSAADTQARLDQFLDGESIERTDVVVWDAGHFLHDEQAPSLHQGHIIGPELRPVGWS
jgi:Copper amine oxidase, enzyme domain